MALERLEVIVHPLVAQAIDLLIRRAKQSVVVIEAIKLLESDLAAGCDTIWVVDAPAELQIARLMHKRKMPEAAARQRIAAQSPQALKLRAAKTMIRNNGSFENTWDQVQEAWGNLPKPEEPLLPEPPVVKPGDLIVRRGRPQDADDIARFITHVTHGKKRMTRQDVMAAFGEKAFLLIIHEDEIAGIAGWQVENLITRIDELYFVSGLAIDEAIPALMDEVETASIELQSEASLLFLPPYLAQLASVPGRKQHSSQCRAAPRCGSSSCALIASSDLSNLSVDINCIFLFNIHHSNYLSGQVNLHYFLRPELNLRADTWIQHYNP